MVGETLCRGNTIQWTEGAVGTRCGSSSAVTDKCCQVRKAKIMRPKRLEHFLVLAAVFRTAGLQQVEDTIKDHSDENSHPTYQLDMPS